MNGIAVPLARGSRTRTSALNLGALTVGVLDGLDAIVFFGLRGVPPNATGC